MHGQIVVEGYLNCGAKMACDGTGLLGLSQLCSVFDQLCYSIMLHYLINYASKCTNYASYMTNYSHIKIVNFIRFSLKMQCKTRRKILQVISSS